MALQRLPIDCPDIEIVLRARALFRVLDLPRNFDVKVTLQRPWMLDGEPSVGMQDEKTFVALVHVDHDGNFALKYRPPVHA